MAQEGTVWQEIGTRIGDACRASGKSMAALAKEIEVTEEALRLWRRGQAFPTRANWMALQKATGVTVEEMLVEGIAPVTNGKAKTTQPFRGGIRDMISKSRKDLEVKARKKGTK